MIVCEGFMGNVVLKLLEGITELAADLAKEAYDSKLIWRLGLTMLSKELKKLRNRPIGNNTVEPPFLVLIKW